MKNRYVKILTLFFILSVLLPGVLPWFNTKACVLAVGNSYDDSGLGNINGAVWTYYDGELSISGIGGDTDIPAFDSPDFEQPWIEYKDKITEISLNKISGIGDYAFYNCNSLIKVTATEDLKKIGKYSFPIKSNITFFAPENSYTLNYAKENFYKYSSTTLKKNTDSVTKKYKVYFYTLTEEKIEPKTISPGDYYGELPKPTRKGFKFIGWETILEEKIESTTKADISSDVSLFARWEAEKKDYKVNFRTFTNENFPSGKIVNGFYSYLPEPSRKGYHFLGWYTSIIGGEKVESYSKVNVDGDITLYAQWEKKKYKIKFANTEGNSLPTDRTISEGEWYGELPVPKKEGYNFLGWKELMSDKVITQYTMFSSSDSLAFSNSVTLWAKWELAEYEIYFDSVGGYFSGGGNTSKTVLFGSIYGFLPEPEKDGYKFLGWFTEEEGGEQIESDTEVKEQPSDYQTLYAHWEEAQEKYTLKFDANGGNLSYYEEDKIVIYDQPYGKMPLPERENYDFKGWFTKKKGGKRVYGNDTFKKHSDITLYARWKPSIKATYNP